MSDDEPYDDEDWYDEDSELEDEATHCPECGAPVHSLADKCPACGYWLSEADRRAMGSGASRPAWQKVTAIVVLIAFLISVLGLAVILL